MSLSADDFGPAARRFAERWGARGGLAGVPEGSGGLPGGVWEWQPSVPGILGGGYLRLKTAIPCQSSESGGMFPQFGMSFCTLCLSLIKLDNFLPETLRALTYDHIWVPSHPPCLMAVWARSFRTLNLQTPKSFKFG